MCVCGGVGGGGGGGSILVRVAAALQLAVHSWRASVSKITPPPPPPGLPFFMCDSDSMSID